MGNNKYVQIHNLVRFFAALLALIIFIAMFIAKQVVCNVTSSIQYTFAFNSGAFFGDSAAGYKGNVLGFIAYLFVFLGGLGGLAFVFIDEMIGKDLTKTLSFVVGGVMVVCGILIALFAPIFKAINDLGKSYTTAAGPIVFGILSIVAGACVAAAPILEDKGL